MKIMTFNMEYCSTHGINQFLLNNEKQRVRLLLAHPVVFSHFLLRKVVLKRPPHLKYVAALLCVT